MNANFLSDHPPCLSFSSASFATMVRSHSINGVRSVAEGYVNLDFIFIRPKFTDTKNELILFISSSREPPPPPRGDDGTT
jgi:hypothetical protein